MFNFSRVDSLKNFAIFTGKHLSRSLFLIKLFFIENVQWLLLAVSCLFFDFTPPCAFDFDQKLTKRCTSNYLVSRDKTISSLFELIDQVLSISEHVLEKH